MNRRWQRRVGVSGTSLAAASSEEFCAAETGGRQFARRRSALAGRGVAALVPPRRLPTAPNSAPRGRSREEISQAKSAASNRPSAKEPPSSFPLPIPGRLCLARSGEKTQKIEFWRLHHVSRALPASMPLPSKPAKHEMAVCDSQWGASRMPQLSHTPPEGVGQGGGAGCASYHN